MNLLDVNPLEVNVSGQEGLPGFSAFVLGKWVHGDEALRACRVDPQSVVFDVWKDLDLQPVQPPVGARHRADLAVGQLTSLKLSTENPWFAAESFRDVS